MVEGSLGEATIDGTNSTWTLGNDLIVGGGAIVTFGGIGTLNVKNGGAVLNENGYIGYQTGSMGSTVTIEGVNSTWTNNDRLVIGGGHDFYPGGEGTLNIKDHGTVSSKDGYIGFTTDSAGTVSVEGMNSTWAIDESLYVGYDGTGTMAVTKGGQVHSSYGSIGTIEHSGANVGSMGAVVIDGKDPNGTPSSWVMDYDLFFDRGSLTITNGGVVSNRFANIGVGVSTGASPAIVVDGVDSTWTNHGDLYVGVNASNQPSSLTISNGGKVTNDYAYIGFNSNSKGTVTVDGPGSVWMSSHSLGVGYVGDGSLTVRNGGTVIADSVGLGYNGHGELHGDGYIVGDLGNGFLVSPGTSTGALHIDGDYYQSVDAKLLIELASGASFDQLLITGEASLAGTLDVSLLDGFAISGERFLTILTANDVSDEFDAVLLPSVPDITFDVIYNPMSVVLHVVAPGLPGDYNQNGIVDAADYTVWRDHLGQTFALTNENFAASTPGIVDQEDYIFWKAEFGHSLGSGVGAKAIVAVPEPASGLLLLLGAAFVFGTRCRSDSRSG